MTKIGSIRGAINMSAYSPKEEEFWKTEIFMSDGKRRAVKTARKSLKIKDFFAECLLRF